MSDLESFSPSESSEGVDPAALERLKEQMREAAKAMKRDQQQEQKQKKTEDVMYQTLIMFVNTLGTDHPLVYYIVRCLSENILSELILSIISLNNPALHELTGLNLADTTSQPTINEQALVVPNLSTESMPLHLRLNIEIWIKLINDKAFEKPSRNLDSIRIKKQPELPKHAFTDLMSYVAQDYLQNQNIQFDGHAIEKFIRALTANLISRLDSHIKSTLELNPNENQEQT